MELLKQVAKHHCKEQADVHEGNSAEDAVEKHEKPLFNKQKEKVNEGKKEKSPVFVFGDSKVNDFL